MTYTAHNGRAVRISASTVGAYRTCPRIFWLGYVAGLADRDRLPTLDETRKRWARMTNAPPLEPVHARVLSLYGPAPVLGHNPIDLAALRCAPATIRGTLVHAAIERALRGGSLDPLHNPIDEIAFAALPHAPPLALAPTLDLEREFTIDVDPCDGSEPVRFSGRKDCEAPWAVYDWKTTKNYALYGKVGACSSCEPFTPEHDDEDDRTCLACEDLQCALYGLERMQRIGATSTAMRWVYLETEIGIARVKIVARPVDVALDMTTVQATTARGARDARRALQLIDETDFARVPYNAKNCSAFGGCDYQEICNLTPEERFLSQMQNVDNFTATFAAPEPVEPCPPGTVATKAPGWYQKPDGSFVNGQGLAYGPGVPAVRYVPPPVGGNPAGPFAGPPDGPPGLPGLPGLPALPGLPGPLPVATVTGSGVVGAAPAAAGAGDPMAAFRAVQVAPAAPVAVTAAEPGTGAKRGRKSNAERAAIAAAQAAATAPATAAPVPTTYAPDPVPSSDAAEIGALAAMLPACANPAEVTAAIAALDAKHARPSIHTRATRIALALRGAAKALEEIADAIEIGGPGDMTAGR